GVEAAALVGKGLETRQVVREVRAASEVVVAGGGIRFLQTSEPLAGQAASVAGGGLGALVALGPPGGGCGALGGGKGVQLGAVAVQEWVAQFSATLAR